MEKLCRLGLVVKTEEDGATKPLRAVKLKDQFRWFLTSEFRRYWNEFKSSFKPQMSKLSKPEKENLDNKVVRQTLEGYWEESS